MTNLAALVAEATEHFLAERMDPAEVLFRRLLEEEPENGDLLRILGVIARRKERMPESLELLQRAVSVAPLTAINHFELGTSYLKSGCEAEAHPCFLKTVELEPGFQQAYVNIGAILEHRGDFEQAEEWCRQAVALNEECAVSHYNLGNVLREKADLTGAQREFEAALRLDPENAKAHWNLAFCLLSNGDFKNGWREYEWRVRAGEVQLDLHQQPLWRGESLNGKSILVHAEQGVGDEILFSSCIPDLLQTAGRVTLGCDPRLTAIFKRSFSTADVRSWSRRKDWAPMPVDEPIDFQIAAGSLPLYLRTSRAAFPSRQNFLVADPAKVTIWRQRFAALGSGMKVGVSWQAGGQPVERRKRSTELSQWLEILRTPGAQFINVQYGERSHELETAKAELGVQIHDWSDSDPLVDLDSFAAKLAALDLVISVGNATVHMAGALGVRAWSILPRVPSWRWMSVGDQSPWYESVKLLRQEQPGDWTPVFRKVGVMLRDELNATPAPQASSRRGLGFDPQGHVVAVADAATFAPSKIAPPTVVRQAEPQAFLHTSGIPATFDAAVAAFNGSDYERAESLCRQILDHTPRHHQACHLYGLIARQTGRPEMAVRSLRRAIAVDDKHPELFRQLANALLDLNQLREAVEACSRAVELKPNDVDALLHLGGLLLNWQKPGEAARCYLQAIQIAPENAKAYNALGAARLYESNYADAVAALRIAAHLKPNYYAAWNNLGRALQLGGQAVEAVAAFRTALDLNDDCFEAALNLANVYLELREFESARLCATRALEIRPNDVEAQRLLNQSAPQGKLRPSNVFYRTAPHYLEQRKAIDRAANSPERR